MIARALHKLLAVTLAVILGCPIALGADATGLPLNLSYSMTKSEVIKHLRAIDTHKINPNDKGQILTYAIPDALTNTKNGLFLKFDRNRLVQIASSKTGLSDKQYKIYFDEMMLLAKRWKSVGVTTIYEDNSNSIYLYKDDRS